MSLDDIKPRERNLVIELVEAAGLDVSDWGNFKGGQDKASVNPKYCYEWAFVEPGKVVVLNIWFAKMHERNGEIFQTLNLRAESLVHTKPQWRKRARDFDLAVQQACRDKLPLRVIVCDGKMRQGTDTEASRVQNRLLDPMPWAVTEYDWNSGRFTIIRGRAHSPYIDQFSVADEDHAAGKRKTEVEIRERDPEVRRLALERARGKCELCGEEGFRTSDGRLYLETHHVIPLSEDGPDTLRNVVAICPNDHRRAHFGENRNLLRTKMLDYLATLPS